jgi:hypothetical protein
MNRDRGFDPNVHEYLDGDRAQVNEEARADADRFANAMKAYANGIEVPGAEVDRAVMGRLQQRNEWEARREGVWQWMLAPQVIRVRPAVAAAALVILAVSATWLATRFASPAADESTVVATAPTVFVRFELSAPEAQTVGLVGSFNEWSGEATPLIRSPDTGVWSATVPLIPGKHEYLFVIDGEQWVPDPQAHAQVDDGFGQTNSVITVGPRGVVRL